MKAISRPFLVIRLAQGEYSNENIQNIQKIQKNY